MLKAVCCYAVLAQLGLIQGRKLQNVAKYAFLVLLFWAKILICAIFYAYSISVYNIALGLAVADISI